MKTNMMSALKGLLRDLLHGSLRKKVFSGMCDYTLICQHLKCKGVSSSRVIRCHADISKGIWSKYPGVITYEQHIKRKRSSLCWSLLIMESCGGMEGESLVNCTWVVQGQFRGQEGPLNNKQQGTKNKATGVIFVVILCHDLLSLL